MVLISAGKRTKPIIFIFPILFLVLVLPFALFGIGFDTEITEPLFRIGSWVMH